MVALWSPVIISFGLETGGSTAGGSSCTTWSRSYARSTERQPFARPVIMGDCSRFLNHSGSVANPNGILGRCRVSNGRSPICGAAKHI